MSQNKHPQWMKGVSDTVYLAFVGVLSIGGALYIYNDIATHQTTAPTAETITAAPIEITPVIETVTDAVEETKVAEKEEQSKVLAVEIEKVETVIVETTDNITKDSVVEAISQKTVTEILPVTENTVKVTTIEEPVITATIEDNKVVEAIPVAENIQQENSPTEVEAVVTKKVEHAPAVVEEPVADLKASKNQESTPPREFMPPPMQMPRMPMPEFVQPQFDNSMQQAAQYIPPQYRSNYYQNNQQQYRQNYNPNYNNQSNQNWQGQRQQRQQRQQYERNNQGSEQYAPWNPGRFY